MIKILRIIKNIISTHLILNFSKKVSNLPIVKRDLGFSISWSRNNFLTINLKPKKNRDLNLISTSKYPKDKFAIILQGPIDEQENFTLETIKIYNKLFPNVKIILSTWITENQKQIEKIKQEDVDVILNDLPTNSGTGNINLQLKNTHAGISLAKSIGLKYVLKTRTDCRIYKPNCLDYLESFLETYPLEKKPNNGSYIPKSRIIGTSIATCKYRIYGMTDICLFGETEDILQYFFYEDEEKILDQLGLNGVYIINETAIKSEILLCIRYLSKISHNLKWTLDDWWEVLKNYFGIISSSEIDFFWKRHEWQYEQKLSRSYSEQSNRLIEHSDWLSLYSSKELNWGALDFKEKWEEKNGIIKKKSIF